MIEWPMPFMAGDKELRKGDQLDGRPVVFAVLLGRGLDLRRGIDQFQASLQVAADMSARFSTAFVSVCMATAV
jgi:hypothetical protein